MNDPLIDQIIQGDSFELLAVMPDRYVDIVIADPPYDLPDDQREYLHNQMLRVSRGQVIVFCPPENLWHLPADQYLFWVKPISTKNTTKSYSRFVEQILVYREGVWNCDRHWSQYTNVFMDLVDDTRNHPYRKPPSLIKRLILNHTNPGDIILDPFSGSGVVLDVAKSLHRHCISIEKATI